jgi:hypothetical protein
MKSFDIMILLTPIDTKYFLTYILT